FHPADKQYFRGGGFSTRYFTKGGMPMTMTRLNFVKGLGPVLQIAEGYSVDLPKDVHETIDHRTDPTRSEEHTSELQSRFDLVCRYLHSFPTRRSSDLFHPADKQYFRGGGFSTRYFTKGGMPMTMTRLNFVKGLGPVLQIAEGYSVDLPKDVHETIDHRTDPTWPTTWFAPKLTGEGAFKDVYSVMDFWGSNHGAISYGHIGADLLTFA